MTRFSVVIVSLNGRQRIHMPLDALRRCGPQPFETILVDNGSTDGLSAFVRESYPEVFLVRSPRNLGFAGGNNLGILNASAEAVVLLNDDTEPHGDWLARLSEAFAAAPLLGAAGCQLLYPGGSRIQHLGGIVHANGLTDHVRWGEEAGGSQEEPALVPCDYVTGAAMAVRREAMAQAGLLDEGFWPIYFEEVDYCERLRRLGWRCAVATGAKVVHHESQTTGRLSARFLKMYHRNRWRYLLKNRRGLEFLRALKAEALWMARNAPWDSLWPCALAYAWAPFQAAEIFRQEGQR